MGCIGGGVLSFPLPVRLAEAARDSKGARQSYAGKRSPRLSSASLPEKSTVRREDDQSGEQGQWPRGRGVKGGGRGWHKRAVKGAGRPHGHTRGGAVWPLALLKTRRRRQAGAKGRQG